MYCSHQPILSKTAAQIVLSTGYNKKNDLHRILLTSSSIYDAVFQFQ